MSRLFRTVAISLITVAAAAGCGSSADDESDSADGAQTEAVSEAGDETDDSQATAGNQDASGNYASVTIGGDTFEVPPDATNLCSNFDNLVVGSFAAAADGSAIPAGGGDGAIQINFGVPVTDWESEGLQAPLVNVDLVGEGIRWFASTERGLGSVDSWTLDGGMATGQAMFEAEEVGSGTVVGSETGSFEIVCR